jgi:hypothetical protein
MMNKFTSANSADNSSGAIPPRPPLKNLPKQPLKSGLEILSVAPPKSDLQPEQIQSSDLADSPIPAPNSTLQYRAIGVILGKYVPSAEHFCKGKLIAIDGTVIDAVVLGRVMPIIQKKLIPEKAYLWIVYPRTVNRTSQLYLQISGVWAPKETGKADFDLDSNVEDGYFSIRGEVLEQSIARNYVIVKIKRVDKEKKLPRARARFKLKLKGILPSNAIGYFWDITVQRQGHNLTITSAKAIAAMPKKPPMKPIRKSEPLITAQFSPPVKRPRI